MDGKNLSDKDLLNLCQQYGSACIKWRWKFAGLLPEVERRKLYEKKGFKSVFHFAKLLCGMSEEQIKQALRLDKKFEKTPKLKKMFVNGEVSPNKLDRIASMASPENEEELVEVVQNLSNRAVETWVRDEKSLHVQEIQEPTLSDEVKKKLLELQNKGIDVNDFILEALQKREEEIELEKQEIGSKQTDSRYVPVRARRVLQKEHGDKCSIKSCNKNADHIHHTQPFSMGRNHDPRLLAPLCKGHHEIAHSINLKVKERRRQFKNR